MPAPIFFRPADGWVGDVIPYAEADQVSLFFLHDRRDPERPGTSWDVYTTTDFASYSYEGTSLAHGTVEDQDLNAYTGSVVEHDGVVHLFYTGQNPAFLIDGTDLPAQVVMHATSTDGMQTWVRHPEHTFGAPDGYEPGDWRDPFVFRPEEDGPWHMLVAGRANEGPERRRGLIADLVSDDLIEWKSAGPFWAPNRYLMHECPEVFRLGDWWYLVYSEYSEAFVTRYRMSRSPFGPWVVPPRDSVDGRGLYAAKSVEHGGHRYFAGWIPTREGEYDDGAWQWAGDLAVHEAVQAADGTLGFRIPTALRESFTEVTVPEFVDVIGDWVGTAGFLSLAAPDGYGVTVAPDAPDQFLLDLELDIGADTTECGVLLRTSADGDEGYVVRLEPRAGRLVFDRWPRRSTGPAQWQVSGDVPHQIELERRIEIAPGPHRLSVLVDGTACVAYLDDRVAMSTRMYDRRTGGLGLFVGEGAVAFTELSVATRHWTHRSQEET
jgi:beta-fructofuranosidase